MWPFLVIHYQRYCTLKTHYNCNHTQCHHPRGGGGGVQVLCNLKSESASRNKIMPLTSSLNGIALELFNFKNSPGIFCLHNACPVKQDTNSHCKKIPTRCSYPQTRSCFDEISLLSDVHVVSRVVRRNKIAHFSDNTLRPSSRYYTYSGSFNTTQVSPD